MNFIKKSIGSGFYYNVETDDTIVGQLWAMDSIWKFFPVDMGIYLRFDFNYLILQITEKLDELNFTDDDLHLVF